MITGNLVKEFDIGVKKDIKKVNIRVVKFFDDLKLEAPVSTGEFRDDWRLVRTDNFTWTITNNMEYASILWAGRREYEGRMYGSDQWPKGGEPMLKKFEYDMERL